MVFNKHDDDYDDDLPRDPSDQVGSQEDEPQPGELPADDEEADEDDPPALDEPGHVDVRTGVLPPEAIG